MKKFLLSILCLLAISAFGQRLPETAVPSHYTINFAPDFGTDSFKGSEAIDVNVPRATNSITLNAIEIGFDEVTVSSNGKRQTAKVSLDEQKEMATLTLAEPIPLGPAKIDIKFTGKLNGELRGLYLSKMNGRKYAVTQFESTDARRAFPCFDEPAYKATFDVSVDVDKGDTAISNGTIISDKPGPGDKHTLTFSTTPRMSTYLVALLVGDWKCISGEQDGVTLRVCAVPGREQRGAYALEATKHILHYYNQYYGIKYPYGKLDQIAIPDFEAGAMENTGAITYRETALLADDKNTSEEQKQGIASVIAHEMAHQWFGDLVTMQWWNDIWLNEGFATWMTHKPMKAWHPEWDMDASTISHANSSMNTDSVAAQRPIRQQATTRGEINALFDGIAYGKTAAVLNMIESYVGEEAFRKGINSYLQKHAYANATAEDFWGEMARVTGKPFDKIMPTFVNQAGVPFVDIKANCENDRTNISVTQKRYFSEPALFQKDSDQLWQIPVCFKSINADGTSKTSCQLLSKKEDTFSLKGCSIWDFPNAGGTGYYRYTYNPSTLQKINAEKMLTSSERVSLVGDEWALVNAGKHHVPDYLAMMQAFKNDRSRATIHQFTERLQFINRVLINDTDRPQFEAFVRSFYKPIMTELGYTVRPNDTPEQQSIREDAFTALGAYGKSPEAISKAKELTAQYMKDPQSVQPSIANIAVPLAARYGDAKLYDEFKRKISEAKSPDEYYRYFYALANFRDPALLQKTMEWTLTPEVRNQDMWLLHAVTENPDGTVAGWNFIKTHFGEIENKASVGGKGAIFGIGNSFCSTELQQDFQNFYQQHKVEGTERNFRIAVENIKGCVNIKQRESQPLAQWLNSQAVSAAL